MSDELGRLRAENARLRALLAQHGIAADEPENTSPRKPELSLEEKVTLFRSLFQGREDVFARRWFSPTTGKSGYQPVCSREWNREFCDKKKFKCRECPNREFQPLGYSDIYRHLEGKDPNGRDVRNGDVFIFIGGSRRLMKLLHAEDGGMVMYVKRLQAGQCRAPCLLHGAYTPALAGGQD